VQFEVLFEEKTGWERPSRSFGLADSKVQADALGGRAWGKTVVFFPGKMEDVAAF
jgi:hypothetical protein